MSSNKRLSKKIIKKILFEHTEIILINVLCLFFLRTGVSLIWIGIIDIPILIIIIASITRLLIVRRHREVKRIECQRLSIKRIEVFGMTWGYWIKYDTLEGKQVRRFSRPPSCLPHIVDCNIEGDEICELYRLKNMNMLLGYNEKGRQWCEEHAQGDI